MVTVNIITRESEKQPDFAPIRTWQSWFDESQFDPIAVRSPDQQAEMRSILWALDRKGIFTLFENSDSREFRVSPEHFLGHSAFEIFRNEPPALNLIARGFTGEKVNKMLMIAGLLWEITCYPLRDEQENVAGLAGVAKNRIEKQASLFEQDVIYRFLTRLRSAVAHSDMPPMILDQVTESLQPDGVLLALCSWTSGEMIVESARGIWDSLAGQKLTLPPFEKNQLHLNQRVYLPRLVPIELKNKNNFPIVGIPLVASDIQIGSLWIASRRSLSPSEIWLLTAVGDISASAICRASQHDQTRLRLQRLTLLHDIDRTLTRDFDLDKMLTTVLERIVSQLGIDAASVLLLNETSQQLDYVAGLGFRHPENLRISLNLAECLGEYITQEDKLIVYSKIYQCPQTCRRAVQLEKEAFATYFGAPLIARGQLKGILEIFHRKPFNPEPEWFSFLETIASQIAIAVDNTGLFDDLQQSNAELINAYETTLEGWIRALDLRDKETEGHTQRVTNKTIRLAKAIGIDEFQLLDVRRGALLHDIGKIGIPDSILNKPGPLSAEEWEVMRRHPIYAYNLLSPITYLQNSLHIPLYHHEKWDGTGYPHGLKGKEIPLPARIFAVVDVWDALSSDRPYRPAWSDQQARAYIQQQAGVHFDPHVVDSFFALGLDSEMEELH